MTSKGIRKFIIIAVVIILASIGYVIVLRQTAQPKGSSTTPTTNTETGQVVTPGTYLTYSPETYAQAAETRRWLFFSAPWCLQCHELDKSIISSSVPSGITILKVNYDEEVTLRQRYGVTLQATVVEVDKHDNLIKKYVAYDTPSLQAVLTNLGD